MYNQLIKQSNSISKPIRDIRESSKYNQQDLVQWLVLPFIFNSGGRIWDCRLNKDSPGGRVSVSGRSYIPETSLIGWAFLN